MRDTPNNAQDIQHHLRVVLERAIAYAKSAIIMADDSFNLCWQSDSLSHLFPDLQPSIHTKCYSIFNLRSPCENCIFLSSNRASDLIEQSQKIPAEPGRDRYFRMLSIPVHGTTKENRVVFDFIQEVTTQHQDRARYSELYEFHKNIITNAPVAIFTISKEGVITSTNPAHLKIAGNPPRDKVIGFNWLNSKSVKESGLYEYLRRGISGEPFEVNDVPYTGNLTGREMNMTLRGVPLKAPDSSIESLLCILEDTTEKTRYMNELKRMKDYNEHIIDSITDGVAVVDSGFNVQTINRAMARMFNIEPDTFLGKNAYDLFASIGANDCPRDIELVFSTGLATATKNIKVSYKGQTLSLDYTIMPLYNEKHQQYGAIVNFDNVSEKEEIELRFQHLFETANDAILVTDTRLNILAANRKTLNMLNIQAAQGRNLKEFFVGQNVTLLKKQLHLLLSGAMTNPYEIGLGEGARSLTLEINMSLIKEHGDLKGVQFIVRDITQRIKLEEQLMQATKMAALGEMAAGFAHEINNPIATIAASSEEAVDLMDEHGVQIQSQLKTMLEKLHSYIQEQCYRCKKISDDLLDYARVKRPLTHPIDVNQTIIKVMNLAALTEKGLKNRIRMNLDNKLPTVKSNGSYMQQVFLNLISNALDATEERGTIIVSTSHFDSRVFVKFEDTGTGISQEHLEKVFDPFFTTKPPNKGTGLGLAVSYKIVQRLNGSIKVSSKEGGGTVFTVSFPVEAP